MRGDPADHGRWWSTCRWCRRRRRSGRGVEQLGQQLGAGDDRRADPPRGLHVRDGLLDRGGDHQGLVGAGQRPSRPAGAARRRGRAGTRTARGCGPGRARGRSLRPRRRGPARSAPAASCRCRRRRRRSRLRLGIIGGPYKRCRAEQRGRGSRHEQATAARSPSSRRPRGCRRKSPSGCRRWRQRSIRTARRRSSSIRSASLASGHFAGDDATRAAAFVEVANDEAYDAVWFARGGYGAGRLVEPVLPALGAAGAAQDLSRLQRRRRAAGGALSGRLQRRGAWSGGAGHPARGRRGGDRPRAGLAGRPRARRAGAEPGGRSAPRRRRSTSRSSVTCSARPGSRTSPATC